MRRNIFLIALAIFLSAPLHGQEGRTSSKNLESSQPASPKANRTGKYDTYRQIDNLNQTDRPRTQGRDEAQEIPTENYQLDGDPSSPLGQNKNTDDEKSTGSDEVLMPIFGINLEASRRTLPIFGSDLFSLKSVELVPGSIDPDSYFIAPGDKLLLEVWGGDLILDETLEVTSDLYVDIPNIGRVYLGGQTLANAQDSIRRELINVYYSSFIDPDSPSSSKSKVQLSPIDIKDVQFMVLGEVKTPGTYSLHFSLANLTYALAMSGGVKPSGSIRSIQIRRGNKTRKVDFYDLLLHGRLDMKKAQIQSGDVIFVPLMTHSVAIHGQVRRPAQYELQPEEDLSELLQMAGGTLPSASLDKATIYRIERNEGLRTVDVSLHHVLNPNQRKEIPLQDQDVVVIFSTSMVRLDYVSLKGNGVSQKGDYQLRDGMTVLDLIIISGGLTGHAYRPRADLVRTGSDLRKTYHHLDLNRALAGDSNHNLELQSLDELITYTIQEIVGEEGFVTLAGHVKNPGEFPFFQGMHLYDVLFAKGGFQDRKFLKKTHTARVDVLRLSDNGADRKLIKVNLGDLLNGDDSENLKLENEDLIIVYSQAEISGALNTVDLVGHVKRPGEYPLHIDMTLIDLLGLAGGFQDSSYLKKTYQERADIRRLVRDGKELARKLIRFNLGQLLRGNDSDNHILEAGDEIVIYSAEAFTAPKTVSIDGFVRRPGKYSYSTNMTLGDLLVQAGGLTEGAYAQVEVFRIKLSSNPGVERKTIKVTIDESFFQSEAKGLELTSNDHVFVRKHPNFRQVALIELTGELQFPGKYVLQSGHERLSDLIKRVGGMTESAYSPAARLFRIEDPSKSNEIDPGSDVGERLETTLNLRPHLSIAERQGLRLGPEHIPGWGPLLRSEKVAENSEDAKDTNQKSGEEENENIVPPSPKMKRVIFDLRRALENPGSDYDLVLYHGDRLEIPKFENLVQIKGWVLQESTIAYEPGEGADYYIERAGGFSESAAREQVTITYPDGSVVRSKSRFLGLKKTKVVPMSIIMVPTSGARL